MTFAAKFEERTRLIASDLMTGRVITTPADASVQAVARLMLENGIGAAPVLDAAGAPIGMVSDGDLLGRRPEDYRREWWLELLADAASSRDIANDGHRRPIRDVMSAPLIAIDPETPAPEIARLLQSHRIKRLPVIRDGKLVGIVSRTDLLGVIEQFHKIPQAKGEAGAGLVRFLKSLAGGAHLLMEASRPPPVRRGRRAGGAADTFRRGVSQQVRAYEQEAIDRAAAEKQAARMERQREAKLILRQHVSDESWRKLLDHAEVAAKHGEKEFLLHRFPCDLCTDGGRMIDVAEPGWETTLRGKPAELLDRWRAELKPKGLGSRRGLSAMWTAFWATLACFSPGGSKAQESCDSSARSRLGVVVGGNENAGIGFDPGKTVVDRLHARRILGDHPQPSRSRSSVRRRRTSPRRPWPKRGSKRAAPTPGNSISASIAARISASDFGAASRGSAR